MKPEAGAGIATTVALAKALEPRLHANACLHLRSKLHGVSINARVRCCQQGLDGEAVELQEGSIDQRVVG